MPMYAGNTTMSPFGIESRMLYFYEDMSDGTMYNLCKQKNMKKQTNMVAKVYGRMQCAAIPTNPDTTWPLESGKWSG